MHIVKVATFTTGHCEERSRFDKLKAPSLPRGDNLSAIGLATAEAIQRMDRHALLAEGSR